MRLTTTDEMKLVDDPAARALVREAHSRMYEWPVGFSDYRAHATVGDDGPLLTGTVSLVPRKSTTVELSGADSALQKWVRERLWTQGIHLTCSPFEEGDGKYIRYVGYGEKKLVV